MSIQAPSGFAFMRLAPVFERLRSKKAKTRDSLPNGPSLPPRDFWTPILRLPKGVPSPRLTIPPKSVKVVS